MSSSDQAEALKGDLEQQQRQLQQRQQRQEQQPEPQQATSTSSSADGNSQSASRRSSSSDKPKGSKKVPNPLVWIDLEMTGQGVSVLVACWPLCRCAAATVQQQLHKPNASSTMRHVPPMPQPL
jgi:hypothetical protein